MIGFLGITGINANEYRVYLKGRTDLAQAVAGAPGASVDPDALSQEELKDMAMKDPGFQQQVRSQIGPHASSPEGLKTQAIMRNRGLKVANGSPDEYAQSNGQVFWNRSMHVGRFIVG